MVKRASELEATMIMPIWDAAMGARLRTARQAMDLDQMAFSALLGMAQSSYAKIEAGRSGGTRQQISVAKWSEILGVHTNYVFTGVDSKRYDRRAIERRYVNGRRKNLLFGSDNKSYVAKSKKPPITEGND